MKKLISVLICIALIFSTVCFSSYAAEDTIRYSVDAKPSGAYNSSDSLRVTGWAFDKTGATVRCYYKIDNGPEVMTDPVIRNDVKAAFPTECSQLDCGYNQAISVSSLSFGQHTFTFIARSSNSSRTLAETTFTVAGIKSDCNTIPSGTYAVEDTSALTVVGWAFNYDGSNTDCYYKIDEGDEILLPHYNRQDVVNVFPGSCTQLDCGFNYQIPIYEFTVGTHSFMLIARSGNVSKVIGTSEFTVTCQSAGFQSSADYYLKDTYILGSTELVHLGGWAFDTNGGETRCYYQIDGGALTLLAPDNRKDVMNAFPGSCTQLDCGYRTDISIAGIGKGEHTYKVIARCGRVSEVIKESKFNVISTDGKLKSHPEFVLSGTYNLGSQNTVRVKGWGYNTSAETVKFYGSFDGGKEFYLTTEDRPDVYNSEGECYHVDTGYSVELYLGNLSAGTHSFTARIVSGDKSDVVCTNSFTVVRPTYSVSFNANGGSGAPAQMTKTFGKNLVLPTAEPTREYYKFIGWNTLSDGSGEMIDGSYKYNNSATLYAAWEHEEFELNADSALSFDAKAKLIYGAELTEITAAELKNNFANTSKAVSGSDIVTGTEISISDANGVYDTAQTVILGDVNCDGKIDGTDAVVVSCIVNGMLDETQTGRAVYSAADCLRDSKINSDDVGKLVQAGLLNDTVDQNAVPSRGYYDTDFTVAEGETTSCGVTFNGRTVPAQFSSDVDGAQFVLNAACDGFNFYGIKYSSDTYAKGTVTYQLNGADYSEVFFLEPAENGEFCSFIDGVFENERSTKLVSVSVEPLNAASFSFDIRGISVFNREVPDTVTYFENESIKIGVNMEWGGALSYYEDLDSNVQAVSDKGIIRIDTDAAQRYGTESLNNSVNLINCHDTGRLVQQSYYGTTNYDMGFFNGHYCAYNPVQGGNMYNDSSKIVDLRTDGETLYVKCRPLDWAKEKEYITDSYMEASYTLCGDMLKTSCRFVDFSGYDSATTGQEIPAFYGAATMDKLYYYGGNEPWTDGELSTMEGLDEYLYAHYPAVKPTEHWSALSGEFDDSFSIGLYIPETENMLAGVYGSVTAQTENPDTSNPTSYLAGQKVLLFRSFDPIEYDFYIATGTVGEVRNSFKSIH